MVENPTKVSVSDPDAMDQYLVLVYAGLTGSVTMITCTVLALTRLVFEYKGGPTDLSNFFFFFSLLNTSEPTHLF